MAKFCSLFSSSSGNSTFLSGAKTKILIDAGVSCKRLTLALHRREIKPESIDGIFITHDHSDHVSGVRVFCSKFDIPIYATAPTIRNLEKSGVLNGKFIAYEVTPGKEFQIGDLVVDCAETPHDRPGSCCYCVKFPDERSACVVTDLGHVTPEIHKLIQNCDLALIESNHDSRMLMTGPYPFEVKKRIADENRGHLTNEKCAKECAALFEGGRTSRFYLGHLSQHNNLPELAFETTRAALEMSGAKIGTDVLLEVLRPENENSRIVRF